MTPGDLASQTRARLRLRDQFLLSSLARAGAALLSAAWFIVASRSMGTSGSGDLALLLSIGLVAGFAAEFGLSTSLSIEVAQNPERIRPFTLLVIRKRLCYVAFSVPPVIGAYALAADNRSIVLPLIFSVSLLATPVYSSIHAAQRGLGEVRWEAANELLSRSLVLGFGAIVMGRGGGLHAAVALYALADLCSALVHLPMIARWPAGHVTGTGAAMNFDRLRVVGWVSVANAVLQRLDVWVVGMLTGASTTGLFGAARRLLEAVVLPSNALAALVAPHSARAQVGSATARDRSLISASVAASAAIAVPLALGAPWLLERLYGSEFVPAATALRVLCAGAVAAASSQLIIGLMVVRGPEVLLRLVPAGGTLVLALCAGLGARFGLVGASAGFVSGHWVIAACLITALRRSKVAGPTEDVDPTVT